MGDLAIEQRYFKARIMHTNKNYQQSRVSKHWDWNDSSVGRELALYVANPGLILSIPDNNKQTKQSKQKLGTHGTKK